MHRIATATDRVHNVWCRQEFDELINGFLNICWSAPMEAVSESHLEEVD